jgi:hypothetical protein
MNKVLKKYIEKVCSDPQNNVKEIGVNWNRPVIEKFFGIPPKNKDN